MIVAGVMSGTSADGIDVALVRLTGRGWKTRFSLVKHARYPYPQAVRGAVLAAMNARAAAVADLAQLNFLLGELYAEAVLKTARRAGLQRVELVGCHGQTLYHQGVPRPFLGHDIAATWQTGEGAVIAARVGAPVVSDFRPADMAAGGQGAPLVPFLDYLVYRDQRVGRIVQNLGGIANLTAIPAGAAPEHVVAFDTGPGSMVIDGVMQRLYGRAYDHRGGVAARGRVREDALQTVLARRFFRQRPPKTAGREQFGREFVSDFLRLCRGAKKDDIVATATALTARSVAQALRRFVLTAETRRPGGSSQFSVLNSQRQTPIPHRGAFRELVASGGGTKNRTLMQMLAQELEPLGLRLRRSDEFGVPAEAKEAIAFAVLAYQTCMSQPGNLPAATGARQAAVLGKVSY
ncbi:MAG TPA: anhydro-N-acetylmuramic acid kinase [Terriglobales bacterium]|nr:anhydro-N-acetylmuramic acid kinase [Terriglobales bacterium]